MQSWNSQRLLRSWSHCLWMYLWCSTLHWTRETRNKRQNPCKTGLYKKRRYSFWLVPISCWFCEFYNTKETSESAREQRTWRSHESSMVSEYKLVKTQEKILVTSFHPSLQGRIISSSAFFFQGSTNKFLNFTFATKIINPKYFVFYLKMCLPIIITKAKK